MQLIKKNNLRIIDNIEIGHCVKTIIKDKLRIAVFKNWRNKLCITLLRVVWKKYLKLE